MRRLTGSIALVAVLVTLVRCAEPPPAAALNVAKPICSLAGLVSTLAGRVCSATSHPGQIVGAGKKLLGGHVGGAVESLLGDGAGAAAKTVTAAAGLAAVGAWVIAGARFAMHETASVISSTTRPELQSTWFSASYWRMAGISALLTLPFLFAAAIQALLRSDMALLGRAAFGYLPLGLLAVAIAAPVTMLLLSGSDEMSRIVSSASGNADADFLAKAGAAAAGLSLISRSPFFAFSVGLLTAGATLALWVELLVRSAAVYVIVLMLPLFFAALVWPARRVWAVRAVELLVALILSKFAIVAVLALGGAALGHTVVPSVTSMLAGATLILLAAFSPWVLLRMLPLHELAAGATSGMRHEPLRQLTMAGIGAAGYAEGLEWNWPGRLGRSEPAAAAAVRRLSDDGEGGRGGQGRAASGADDAAAAAANPRAGGGDDGISGATAGGPASMPTGATASTVSSPAASDAGEGPPPPEPGGGDPRHGPAGEAAASASAPEQRLPGMPAAFQAPDNAWRAIKLGMPDPGADQWPPRLLDDPQPPAGSDQPAGPAQGEDHDPRPPGQEPEGGRL